MPEKKVPAASDAALSDPPDTSSPLSKHADALGDALARFAGGGAPADRPATEAEKRSAAGALADVVSGLAGAVRAGGKGAVVGGTFLAELLTATAVRLPLRDQATLIEQHPGLDTEQLADSLVVAASRVSATIGGATGGLAAAQWMAAPILIAVPLELVAETLLVAAVELKLVAELHEIYDARPPGDLGERVTAYLVSWTAQRGLKRTGLAVSLASASAAALRKRINARLARNLGSLLPFLVGAVVGARTNSTSTRKLGQRLRADLVAAPQVIPSQRVGSS